MNDNPVLDKSLEKSLARLLLANRVRELADYPRPVTVEDLGHLSWLFGGIARFVYGTVESLSKGRPRIWKQALFALLDPAVLVLTQLLLQRLRVWQVATGSIRAVIRNGVSPGRRYHARPSSGITSYVTSTDKEEPLIRMCLMLRVLKRHGACIEFLIQRLKSGLPAQETRRWLSFFLSEIHDNQASSLLTPSNGRPDSTDYLPSYSVKNGRDLNGHQRSSLKHGIVLPTMFDSDVFRRSLLSLLKSDFQGEIVVVEEGNQPENVCESFCSQLPVKYVKNSTWTGTSGVANLGIEQMAPDTDVIIFAHNDLLWPPRWFHEYDRAWGAVFHLDKVGIIQFGVLEYYSSSDPVLRELFLQGKYEHLVWILGAMTDHASLAGSIGNLQMNEKDRGNLFGLAMSHWDGSVPGFRGSGIEPVMISFPRRTWDCLGGFDVKMGFGILAELLYHDLCNRRWALRINNAPIIHLTRTDTDKGKEKLEDRVRLEKIMNARAGRFKEKHGRDYLPLSNTFHAETLVFHSDEITDAVNELRFDDIDYIFDEFFESVDLKTSASGQLT